MYIFNAICDQKPIVRECGVDALLSALFVLASRETEENQNPIWYDHCYTEAIKNFECYPYSTSTNYQHYQTLSQKDRTRRDDKVHGSLMVLNELFAVCNNSSTSNPINSHNYMSEKTNPTRSNLPPAFSKFLYHSRNIGLNFCKRSRYLPVVIKSRVCRRFGNSSILPFSKKYAISFQKYRTRSC